MLVEVVDVSVDALVMNEHNPRFIAEDRLDDLKRSMAADPELMRARPVIAARGNVVIAGNMRLAAARMLGWETVPTVVLDLDPDEPRARSIALRDNNQYGEWSEEALPEYLFELAQEPDFDLSLTGFTEHDVEFWLEKSGAGDEPGNGGGGEDADLTRFTVMLSPDQHQVLTTALARAQQDEGAKSEAGALQLIGLRYLGQ